MLARVGLTLLAWMLLPALLFAEMSTPLREDWQVKSGCDLHLGGEVLSLPRVSLNGWLKTTIPSTVLAAQSADGRMPDPYVGTRLHDLPGGQYPIGENFANLPMPVDSPYRCGWWYRKEFTAAEIGVGRQFFLHFGGINYRANIWLNGKRIAGSNAVAGAYRTYDFDVTATVLPGRMNVLAVEAFAPTEKDLGINWVDWNPAPPDKDMGITGEVNLITTGPVTLRSPEIVTKFHDEMLAEADLTVYVELHNVTNNSVNGKVEGEVAGILIEQPVIVGPGESRPIVFAPDSYPQLKMNHPKIWWPYAMGEPHLEEASLRFVADGHVSDEQSIRFGIREVTSELTDSGSRLFRVNRKPILIRGGGWSQDMLLRIDERRLREQFKLVRDLHLNTIRLEGKLETEAFFHLADEQGILVMLGWCCCDQWENWKDWSVENRLVAEASLRSQMLRLRHHASLLVWLNGSDNPPPADIEQMYLQVEADTHWPNPILSSASATPTTVTGKSGVKMTGPYDYVAPSYWYVDTKNGGAYGFNTETSPGPAIPSIASMKKFLPGELKWPPDQAWNYHNGGGEFHSLKVFDDAMQQAYQPATNADQYVRIAQTMQYDSERAMFEAYSRNKYNSTGVVQWMLNNAWPSTIWHLYDYYLDAGGGYFGVKKACEPIHIQYSYDDHSIVVVNSTYQQLQQLRASVHLYDFNLHELFADTKDVQPSSDSSTRVETIPGKLFQTPTKLFFIELILTNAAGQTISRNFYWVPGTLTTFDWPRTDFTHTPALKHEDLTVLQALKPARVRSQAEIIMTTNGREVRLYLLNHSAELAFQVAAAVRTENGELVAPVLWSDNWIELMPGESTTLIAILPSDAPARSVIDVTGWNIASEEIPVVVAH